MSSKYFIKPFKNDRSFGGAVLVDERIEAWLREQSEIETLVITDLSPHLKFQIRNNVFLLLRVLVRMIFTGEPYNVSKFKFQKKAYSVLVNNLKEKISDDSEIVTSGWLSALAIAETGLVPSIHFAHNVEYLISKNFSNSFLRYFQDWKKLKDVEENLYAQYESIYTLTNRDREILQNNNLVNVKVFESLIPDCTHSVSKTNQPIRIGFIGSMAWPANSYALNILLNEVFPLLERRKIDFEFFLAGRGTTKNQIKQNIKVLGVVENVEIFYSNIDVVIIPRTPDKVTGISVKSLEALEFGKYVIGDIETIKPFSSCSHAMAFVAYDQIADIILSLN